MTGKELSLFCIVNNAKFSIYIEDHFSNVYADCLPFNPYQCSVYQPKSNVTYSEKGILTFIITRDEHHIPNVWVCRHGSKSVGIRIELTTKSSTDIATSGKIFFASDLGFLVIIKKIKNKDFYSLFIFERIQQNLSEVPIKLTRVILLNTKLRKIHGKQTSKGILSLRMKH